jgi:hypothetical protein
MRTIPPTLSSSVKSSAERRVFELLRRSELQGASCFHSVNLSEHDYKLVSELDFVVVTPRGVLVLEVKGGGVARHEGIWTYTDRFGKAHHRSEGPFQQARSGMFALRQRIIDHTSAGFLDGIPFGYGVIFPDCAFRERSVEWAEEMVLDADAMRRSVDATRFIERLVGYWGEKHRGLIAPSDQVLRRVGELLRADFDKVPSLRIRADQLDAEMERLTRAQYAVLDAVERAPRIMCEGGAGTGKTFLAAETARRHASLGQRVLLACASPILAAFLRSRLSGSGVEVRIAPITLPAAAEYDVLVVDEGQDLCTIAALDHLDRVIEGGLAGGKWRFFHDVNRQAGLIGAVEPEAMELLASFAPVPMSLNQNCRNTRQVVLQTRLLTAADLGSPTAGDGPPVDVATYATTAEAASLIDAHLGALKERDVPPAEITILSGCADLRKSAALLTKAHSRGRLAVLDERLAEQWPLESTTLSTISDFKGLENRFVLVIDLPGLDRDQVDVNALYVAMSRARAGLWIALEDQLMDSYNTIQMRNYHSVLKDAATAVAGRTR